MDANRLGRLYKGEEYDIDIKIPYSGETFNSFELQFFTDSASTFTVPFPQLRVEGDIIHANIQENDFDLLADGVLRYYIDYIVNDVETILSTNTMHYLKTPDGYSGKTAEDIYNEGYTSGSTDGYNSGYSDGENDQKEKLVTTAITVNGIYTSEDGFSSVEVNVAQSGYTEEQVLAAYNNGYNTGEEEGEITGAANQKALLSAITITENGTYTRENGYSAVTVDVECIGEEKKMGKFTYPGLFARYKNNSFLTTDGQVISVKCTIPSKNQSYYIYDSTNEDYEYGVMIYTDAANNVIKCDIDSSNALSIPISEYTFPFDCVINVYYKNNGYVVLSLVNENGIETVSRQILSQFSFRNYGFTLNAGQGVLSGDVWDKSAENLAIEYIKLYNITTGGTKELIHSFEFDGEYFVDTVDSGITLDYGVLYQDGYDWKPWPQPTSERPVPIDSSYISGTNERGSVIAYENKILTINSNTNFSVDTPYDGITGGTIIISGTVTGSCEEAVEIAYNSGYTAGEAHGEVVGAASQKARMIPITATTNGIYTRTDGYSSINVNIAQTGHTDAELEEAYTSGYTGGEAAGMAAQKALMESGTFTSNGTYSRDNGYSTVYVNVAQTGHTDDDIEEAYTSGYTAGIDAQKELMTELYVTSNGTYTSENGFSTVVVNIDVVEDNEFYFIARTNNSTVTIPEGTKYSTDKTTWVESAGTITLNAGQKLYVRTTAQNGTWPAGAKFATSSGGFDVCGSLTTLLGSNNITTTVEGIFDGCQHIVDASKLGLPQINKIGAYRYAFRGCTSLTKAPVLPTPAQDSYYYGTFYNCSSLTTAPELPGRLYYETPNYTISLDNVYAYMFKGCTSLVYAPQLPETHATSGCYSHMFEGCTSLRMAPELNASYVSLNSYSNMFKDCTSLVVPPSNLGANILEMDCYSHMFDGCSSLRYTPTRIKNGALPDDYRLKPYCYEYMFANCTSLETIDFNFNNSTLEGADGCYQHMFQNCTSLKKIRISTSLYNNATASCNYMFDGCSSLNDITIITCDWDESNSVNWVRGVASGGTFTKWKGFSMETGNNGIPSGWTVVNVD